MTHSKETKKSVHFLYRLMSIALFTTAILSSCFKSEEFPDEPIIADPIFAFSGDSARLTFSFTDGDGDIGLAANDTLPPFNPTSFYHYNLHIDYFEKDDVNGWQQGLDLDGEPIIFQYRLNPIIVKGKARGIKGTMDVIMVNFANPFSTQSDTIKYTVKLIDKALNESNVIETEEIYL